MTRGEAAQLATALWDDWRPTLRRYALRITHSAEAADDLVQEVFLAFYRALRQGESIEQPRAWLLVVLRNQIGKLDRTTRRRLEQLEPPDVMDSFPIGMGSHTDELLQEFDPREFAAVLSRREEEVLMLRLASLKYREIASELGIATRAVSTLLARALAKLQAAMERKRAGLPFENRTSRGHSKTLQ